MRNYPRVSHLSDPRQVTGAVAALQRAAASLPVTPEDFRAIGDGSTDDYTAFQKLVADINEAGGGVVKFGDKKTYYIGQYVTATNGVTDLVFNGCNGLVIEGNGAKIDLKGDFDRDVSTTRGLSIYFSDCQNVTIRDLEIDGNVDQMTNSSLSTEANTYGIGILSSVGVDIKNVYVHHMATDGILLKISSSNGTNYTASRRITMRNVSSLYNARQGMSVVQARGVVCENSSFSYTGRSTGTYGVHSPAAGVDIEPSRSTATAAPNTMDINTGDVEFNNCVFEENVGSQIVFGGSLPYDNVRLTGGRIVVGDGSTSGADCVIVGCPGFVMRDVDVDIGQNGKIFYIWPNAANVAGDMLISGGRFTGMGTLMRTNGSPVGQVIIEGGTFRANGAAPFSSNVLNFVSGSNVKFRHNFIFIPKEMYIDGGTGDRHIIMSFANIAESANNSFSTDLLAASGSGGTAHYANSYGAATVVRDDKYTGTAVGTVDTFRPVFNSAFDTNKFYNKLNRPTGTATYDPPSIAAAGTTTTTVTVTGAALGDMASVTFSRDLAGLVLAGSVSAVDTVTAVFYNPTAGAIDLSSGTLTAQVWV